MLLEKLVIDLQIKDSIIINYLDLIGNNNTFSMNLFKGFDKGQTERILNKLLELEILDKKYSYECINAEGLINVAEDTSSSCIFCGEEIEHINHAYKVKYVNRSRKLIEEISDYEKQKILKIIDERYINNLRLLKKSLSQEKVIPFIGAGTSIPLGLPNWQGLIQICSDGLVGRDKDEFENSLAKGDIFSAIEILTEKSVTYSEPKIKEEIASYIKKNLNYHRENLFHNINDILNLNSDFYLTTNYDDALTYYQHNGLYPYVVDDIENLQDFFNEKQGRVVHLHGMYQRPKTMIVSKSDYEEMYSNEKTGLILGNMVTYKLLFIGFSFEDQYFKDMYRKLKKYVGGSHYIILFDAYDRDVQTLKEIGLQVISLKLTNEYGYQRVDLIKEVFKYLIK